MGKLVKAERSASRLSGTSEWSVERSLTQKQTQKHPHDHKLTHPHPHPKQPDVPGVGGRRLVSGLP